jgi:hypothetical protein
MAKEVRWTKESVVAFEKVVLYLEREWTEKEIESFIQATHLVLGYLSKHPLMFRKSSIPNVREALITSHNLLVYKIYDDHISLLTFWDTRQHPKKKISKLKSI